MKIEAMVDDPAITQPIVPADEISFRECARLIEGKSPELIATAKVCGFTDATHNERDFQIFNDPMLNSFHLA